jgi:cyclopropane fatty-acyl-phospholipid synthase-like methyltransferase
MTKVFTDPFEAGKETIDKKSVANFFKDRAAKVEKVGPISAVIYQDKNPDLALQRNQLEKELLLPILDLSGMERVLDLGCGTGRWTADVSKNCKHYHGVDFSCELIQHAKTLNMSLNNVRFSVFPAEKYTLTELNEDIAFDRVMCIGVLMYLNDEDLKKALHCMGKATSKNAKIVLREPVGIKLRLTIKEHFSDELEQYYSAIYRTEEEIKKNIEDILGEYGFLLTKNGNMYPDHLNNRKETVQKWFLLERINGDKHD